MRLVDQRLLLPPVRALRYATFTVSIGRVSPRFDEQFESLALAVMS